MDRREFLKLSSLLLGGLLSQGFSLNKLGQPDLVNTDTTKITRARFQDITLPLLTFGMMRLPANSKHKYGIDEKQVQEMVDYAMAHGANFFDTAYMYMSGNSEIVTGNVLKKHPRDSYYVSDKLPVKMVNSKTDNEKLFNEQLKKTGFDYFDFYFAHSLNRDIFENNLKKYDVYEFLQKKKREGKVKYVGFSFHDSPDALEPMLKAYKWDFAMIQLNYLDWDLIDAKQMYETVQKYNVPIWVMEPVKGGQLASLNPQANKILSVAKPGTSTASWAIRYAASFPGVITVLSGMSNMEQLKDNIKTMTDFKPLSNSERTTLTNAVAAYRASGTIPCTNCKYCTPYCPKKVDIPNNLVIYNQYLVDKSERVFTRDYKALQAFERADRCINCKACLPHCPQKINIPENLTKVSGLFKQLAK
ncbi:MAG: aldo/keto reductase [Elusimicrobiota bacterium]|jgi:predicted aldo/keto reductase-like oxidoreductase|nr:aldo/keto reductase [Elusimicrobiota bacterium]